MNSNYMQNLIEKASHLNPPRTNELLTPEAVVSPFDKNLGDIKAKLPFFVEMAISCIDNKQKLNGGEYITERRVVEFGLSSFDAPKRLVEEFGRSVGRDQVDIRIFSESGNDIIIGTFFTKNGKIVPKDLKESKIKSHCYWIQNGNDTYRIQAENEQKAISILKSEHLKKDQVDDCHPEILRVEDVLESVDDPSGPFRVTVKNPEGGTLSRKEVSTIGGIINATYGKSRCEVSDKDGNTILEISREVPKTESSQRVSASDIDNLLKGLRKQGIDGQIVVLPSNGRLETFILPEDVEKGTLVELNGEKIIRIKDIIDDYAIAENIEHVTQSQIGRAIFMEAKKVDCECPACKSKVKCTCSIDESDSGDIYFYGAMKPHREDGEKAFHFSPDRLKVYIDKDKNTKNLPLAFTTKEAALKNWDTAKGTSHLLRLDKNNMIHLVHAGQNIGSPGTRPPEPKQSFKATGIIASKLRQAVSKNEGTESDSNPPYRPLPFPDKAIIAKSKKAVVLDRTKLDQRHKLAKRPSYAGNFILYYLTEKDYGGYRSFVNREDAIAEFEKNWK